MDDIDRHPEVHFRDPGSPFQVSARPEDSPTPGLDVRDDNTNKHKSTIAPKYSLGMNNEEGHNVGVLRRRSSCCCIMM